MEKVLVPQRKRREFFFVTKWGASGLHLNSYLGVTVIMGYFRETKNIFVPT
jgi:hypothetical protein